MAFWPHGLQEESAVNLTEDPSPLGVPSVWLASTVSRYL